MLTGKGKFTSQEEDKRWGGPPVVPTTTWCAAVLMLAHGDLGVRYIPLIPVSAIAVLEGVILGGRVGLQLELGKKIGFALTAHSKFRLSLAPPPVTTKLYPNLCSCFVPGRKGDLEWHFCCGRPSRPPWSCCCRFCYHFQAPFRGRAWSRILLGPIFL